jgi:glucosamine-6-phosphate isomerase
MRQVTEKPDSFICLPSGESPTGTLKYLVQFAKEGKLDFSHCRFIGLDEWIGIEEHTQGSTKYYLYDHFFKHLNLSSKNLIFFDSLNDPAKECKRIDALVQQNGPIDLMLVGIGMNGHIGLNEPGVDLNSYAHYIDLDPLTVTVAQKYFTKETQLEKGITLGAKHMLEAKKLVLIASGKKKAAIVSQALEGPVTNQVPASVLQDHPDSYAFLDEDAASELSGKK